MLESRQRLLSRFAPLLLLAALLLAAPLPADEPAGSPAEAATRFLRTFEKKDFQTLRTLFAPEAVVAAVNLSRAGAPEKSYAKSEDWIKDVEGQLASVDTIKIDILSTQTLQFDQGATVSLHFRATGTAGDKRFTNEGIDTYALTRAKDGWKVLQYSYLDLLEFH